MWLTALAAGGLCAIAFVVCWGAHLRLGALSSRGWWTGVCASAALGLLAVLAGAPYRMTERAISRYDAPPYGQEAADFVLASGMLLQFVMAYSMYLRRKQERSKSDT